MTIAGLARVVRLVRQRGTGGGEVAVRGLHPSESTAFVAFGHYYKDSTNPSEYFLVALPTLRGMGNFVLTTMLLLLLLLSSILLDFKF